MIEEPELVAPGSEAEPKDPNTVELPCGCVRSMKKRSTVAFHDCPGQPEHGTPILDAAGGFTMREEEDITTSYCAEHAKEVNTRSLEVAEMLKLGATADEAIAHLEGRQDPMRRLVAVAEAAAESPPGGHFTNAEDLERFAEETK